MYPDKLSLNLSIRPEQVIEAWSWQDTSRNNDGTVRAAYRDRQLAKDVWVTVGAGEPVRSLRHKYPNETSARAAASARLNKGKREGERVSLTIAGKPEIKAEGLIQLIGFYRGVDATYSITRVEHRLQSEFMTLIEATKLL